MNGPPRTLYQKLWDSHLVAPANGQIGLLYIDRHLLHEVTSPQAFEGLHLAQRPVWRAASALAVPDHNVPTTNRRQPLPAGMSRRQIELLDTHVAQHRIDYLPLHDPRQGIVHVIGPEQGFTLPGTTLVCGDSHTSTHGAFACLALGIGTSDVEHVLATQTLRVPKARTLRVEISDALQPWVSAKDLALTLIGRIGAAGATDHVIEFSGPAVRALSMEGRMTLCNMSIEAGARTALIAVDAVTIEYVRGRPRAPRGDLWEQAVAQWSLLHSDADAMFDAELSIDASTVAPQVTWGTSPDMVCAIDGCVPDPDQHSETSRRHDALRALAYMDLRPGSRMDAIYLDCIFIGSCTNARIEDLRIAASVLAGRHKARNIRQALVVPGSGLVKAQAEQEGLDRIFIAAGFEWREPGCSMCLGMNGDLLEPGERCAASSNRNFEGRQGAGGRTHLVSPAMAAAAAVAGRFTDVRHCGHDQA
jgi:3-isopropylmalate/(R)-2-methylmalate dehydratase large subunit